MKHYKSAIPIPELPSMARLCTQPTHYRHHCIDETRVESKSLMEQAWNGHRQLVEKGLTQPYD
ncbi:hypothetical protein PILCRDRAFT_830317 [Piloderma croceum F 1598]|uniref:Uncharacterized protein n=1 Tax=Piloderma croceum (strain F 1598) TaxID=765440 RepID=A0A0C3EUE4_PILCF|nr:hypothetical protein PILCRDRAFT_830317 [Piloderma croceum F 1598]